MITIVDTLREQAENVVGSAEVDGVVVVNRDVVLVSVVVIVGSRVLVELAFVSVPSSNEVVSPSIELREKGEELLVLDFVLDSEIRVEQELLKIEMVLDSEVKVEEIEDEANVEVGSRVEVASTELDSMVQVGSMEETMSIVEVGAMVAVGSTFDSFVVVADASWWLCLGVIARKLQSLE